MNIKFKPLLLFLFFTIIFFVFYKGLKKPNIYIPDRFIEKNVPFFSATLFESNKKINSKEIFKEDKFYLINIWASWCVPCRKEHNFLMNLSTKKNLKIIGINYKDNDVKAKDFLKELNSPYELIISDPNGTISIEWGAYGVPETFLIYDKKIIKKIIGPINNESLVEIKSLIK
tara:strand:- start:285 stop:803 length:519 start_codon:yes stop_codon:yes gene_type:complete